MVRDQEQGMWYSVWPLLRKTLVKLPSFSLDHAVEKRNSPQPKPSKSKIVFQMNYNYKHDQAVRITMYIIQCASMYYN